ncbi:MAG: solute carrier family 13 (sodium-dependent dicarboxylate transporter), er 2/3/5 [Acidobacteriota bacterium]|jgi:sodium-dependent dicarboxylate transporter 2/3/5|nr:solute carrier family 13 (sodium-dependent dicarboxylate transporter), er 2/3/5 [Acidobacteriota bacterium]
MSSEISLRKVFICVIVAGSLLLVPVTADFTAAVRFTSAVGLLMALLWLTEAVPMGLTALLPLVLFPLAGIGAADKIAAPYANSAVFLFMGGFLVSATFERWGLHKRIAFFALSTVGTQPRRIVFAVMAATAFLSMWISNTATTLMMAPIAVAIMSGLKNEERTAEATLLGVAYGASLGGIGTPIGTPTNLIFLGAARELFPHEKVITFAEWMLFGVPFLLLAVPLCWLILVTVTRVGRGAAIPLEQLGLEKPGTWSRPEKTALALCMTTALLWIFRADIALGAVRIPGWANLFPAAKMIQDATVAMAMAMVAFLLPVGRGERLLGWSEFKRIPWDVLILFGGGFALADALETSGFSKWAGARLAFVGSWPPVLMIVVVCLVVTLLSEVASNVATATAMMPVAAALAVSIHVHPYFLMIPAVLAASSGFMLPVATAPNTIVYGTGLVRVKGMARAGFLLDLAAAAIITLLIFTVIPWATGMHLR